MFSSHRLPRNAVVCSTTVTRSSSSAAGSPVRSSAGRTLAAIARSTIQTSLGLTPRIFVLHPVEHQRAVERGLVAQGHVRILIGDFQQSLTNGPTLGFGQLRELFDDFRCAHSEIISGVDNLSGERVIETFSDQKRRSAGN